LRTRLLGPGQVTPGASAVTPTHSPATESEEPASVRIRVRAILVGLALGAALVRLLWLRAPLEHDEARIPSRGMPNMAGWRKGHGG